MTTATYLLICSLAAMLAAVAVLALVLHHQQTKMWMRAFGEQHGITPISMEGKPEKKEVAPQPKPRKRLLSIPIPGADLIRRKAE